jgi:hypothetical protein
MIDHANMVFTASTLTPVTQELLESALRDNRLSLVNDFAKITFLKRGTAFPRTPRYEFGVAIPNNVFGSSVIEAANQAAFEMLHSFRAHGIDVTPRMTIHQTHEGFHRDTGLGTSFDDAEGKFRTYAVPTLCG